jgi:hypothetical protein
LPSRAPTTDGFPVSTTTFARRCGKKAISSSKQSCGRTAASSSFSDADFTFLNGQLAKHYGYAGVEGSEFRRVPLEGGWRGGVLTQASVLTVTSNPTRTSPVKRGKWILEQILGISAASSASWRGELKEGEAALHGTLRQRMEQHRANPLCASCHEAMDPLGFGLECFDAVGAYREEDGGIRIDASERCRTAAGSTDPPSSKPYSNRAGSNSRARSP